MKSREVMKNNLVSIPLMNKNKTTSLQKVTTKCINFQQFSGFCFFADLFFITFFFLKKGIKDLQKRLVVVGCQLRKTEVSKRSYEVAVDKLTKFVEVISIAMKETLFHHSVFFQKGIAV